MTVLAHSSLRLATLFVPSLFLPCSPVGAQQSVVSQLPPEIVSQRESSIEPGSVEDRMSLRAAYTAQRYGAQTTAGGLQSHVAGQAVSASVSAIVQTAYIKPSNTDSGDQFGVAMAISGDTAVVGSFFEDSDGIGVNSGAGSNDNTSNSGAAYVFRRSGATWIQEAYLKASNSDADDLFGNAVAIDGDTIVVGAPWEDSNGTGVNSSAQANNSSSLAGAAYVFTRSGTTWSQQAYLKASNTDAGDEFGYAVAVSGDTLAVGANREDSSGVGINGGAQADDSEPNAGAVYVFTRSGTDWTQQAYVKASNTDQGDFFGVAVAVDEDTLLVGANNEDSSGTGVNGGSQGNNSHSSAGAAYLFTRSGTTWSQEAYLKASNTDDGDFFGVRVALDGDAAVVGAPFEESGSTGVNGLETDNSLDLAGAAYVFRRSGGAWAQEAYLKASNSGDGDQFGTSVAISGDTIAVGAYQESSGGTGINGPDQADDSQSAAGAIYAFTRSGTTWSQVAYVKASNTDDRDRLGRSIGLSGGTLIAGANGEDSDGTGVNSGAQADNSANSSGAAYVIELDNGMEVGSNYCMAAANSTGVAAQISAKGTTQVADNDLTLLVVSLPSNAFGYFLTSQVQGFVMNPAGSTGNLCLVGEIGRYVGAGQIQNSGTAGEMSLAIDLTQTPQPTGLVSIAAGETWNFQAWFRDTDGSGVATSNFTDGLEIDFQ